MNKILTNSKNRSNDRQMRVKKLRYRSWHRGCKETDLILGQFADATLENMNDVDLETFEALLAADDTVIWDWLTGKDSPPTPALAALISTLRGYGVAAE